MMHKKLLIIIMVFAVSTNMFADTTKNTLDEVLVLLLGWPQMINPAMLSGELNRYSLFSTYQESQWSDYMGRNPYAPGKFLPMFGSFDATLFASPVVGDELLFSYTTYCIGVSFPLSCYSSKSQKHKPGGVITQIDYSVLEITPLFIRIKLRFFGNQDVELSGIPVYEKMSRKL